MSVSVAWFEIPVEDMGRAVEFYGSVLGEPLGTMDGPDGPMHVFPADDGAAGALTATDSTPAKAGVLVYLETSDIPAALARAESAGGEIVQEKTSIGPYGFIGKFNDTEGNTVALHTSID